MHMYINLYNMMIKIWFKKDQLVFISQVIKGPINSYGWESSTFVFSPVHSIIAVITKIIFVKKQIILIKLSYIICYLLYQEYFIFCIMVYLS